MDLKHPNSGSSCAEHQLNSQAAVADSQPGRRQSLTPTPEARTPNLVDLHVGGRVRMRRKMLGVSQEHLADALKLTFQQVQKYERGSNRVSASKLYEIARALQVPVSYFFDGLADPMMDKADEPGVAADRVLTDFLNTPEGLELAAAFPKVGKAPVRRQILDLVRAMAE
jgi:transcriptional regulator with XRE-family HTH domain